MQSSNVISVLHQPQQSPTNVAANQFRGQYNQYQQKCQRSNSVSLINSVNKRKRKESIVLPTKFLLGGNINDPLNLASLTNRGEQLTPQSSPLQTETKQVEIIIPANLNDPLNLNCGDGESESSANFKRGNRKKRRKRTDSETTIDEAEKEKAKEPNSGIDRALHLNLSEACLSANKCEKIVSPVVPQNGPLGKHRKNTPEKAKVDEKRFHRFHRSTNKSNKDRKHNFRKQDEKFRYGNYNRYYGYRNHERNVDPRLAHFRRTWFENKEVLDIGCNVGFVTLMIAKHFNPQKIIGIDIDEKLIASARKNVRHYITKEITSKANNFPISMLLCHGPIIAQPEPSSSQQLSDTHFPHNIAFLECNYVLDDDEQLAAQKPEFDTIVCLSVTKWIHLNWGDQGLKRFFKRIYAQLRPGGIFILEAQPLCSYKRKKFVTEETLKNFQAIKFKPEQFNEYLLSKEVGFNTCHLIDTPEHASKG